jgi:hypothetical protein
MGGAAAAASSRERSQRGGRPGERPTGYTREEIRWTGCACG